MTTAMHKVLMQARLLRQNQPSWQDEFRENAGFSLSDKGPGLSWHAIFALGFFGCLVVFLTLVVCILRIRQWRIHRWHVKHEILPDEKEELSDSDEEFGNIFKRSIKRDTRPDMEYIRRTMSTASGFVKQCLDSATSKKAARESFLLNDTISLGSSSSSSSSSSSTTDDTVSTVTTVQDEECPTIRISVVQNCTPQEQEGQPPTAP